ncbi:hypothetical protein RPD_0759 [Rhodopseudomonas palustris BisB5]|uniref:Uncharacterized protein n=1 Tax=Rhodopseudomonas palustris (strain BisB5) TaxID=316057 RepID=Q13D42_RHOPS|nr:hypothetical protein RPD_0759 [Rhodopseudomonas palustris BisB5]
MASDKPGAVHLESAVTLQSNSYKTWKSMMPAFGGRGFWPLAVVLLALVWMVWIYASVYPGAMSADSIAILGQARSGAFLDAHPPALGLIWRWVDSWIPGPQGMLALHLVGLYGGVALVMSIAALRVGPIAGILLPGFLINPAIGGIVGVIWTDILMAAALTSAVGLIAFAGISNGTARYFTLAVALFAICVGIASRHNAAAAAIPLVAGVLFALVGRRKSIIGTSAVLASSVAVTLLLFVACNFFAASVVHDRQHFWTVLAQYDVAGIAARTSDASIDALFAPATLEDVQVLYTPRSVIPLLIGEQVHAEASPFPKATPLPSDNIRTSENLRDQLSTKWLNEVQAHPMDYLAHRSAVFGSLIGLPPFQTLWAPVFTRVDPNDLGVPSRGDADSSLYRLMAGLSSTIVFNPAAYLAVCGLGFLASLLVVRRRPALWAPLALALFASGLLHMVGLFFSAVSSDFRYSYWMIVAATLGAICLILAVIDGKSARRRP